MERQTIKVKEWFIDKTQETASRYNTYIDYERKEDHTALVEDGYLTVVGTVEVETEKALKIRFETGAVVGSYKGWSTWTPKSVVLIEDKENRKVLTEVIE